MMMFGALSMAGSGTLKSFFMAPLMGVIGALLLSGKIPEMLGQGLNEATKGRPTAQDGAEPEAAPQRKGGSPSRSVPATDAWNVSIDTNGGHGFAHRPHRPGFIGG